ncbi:tyrosine-protein phosphatase [Chondromyces crocatus]|uniref:protein-tyrosine-phosphatase n=1 Tax=Chondromyces crocatus TaxID=52 RepID=A0A0K1EQM3_CHOCO|nr:CpsB/CapC family capsule biosynthesis tyrosine phosphatase [Chondromyces crocatus]AKT43230.1 protein-tyrosine phosphatase [Chondromyces crocatus]
MRGFIDLHAHWVAGVDDGARSFADSMNLLSALHSAGFDKVVATPHMRPGMFDNTRDQLCTAYEATCEALRGTRQTLPELGLASEHFFDDVVYQRLLEGLALPYPGGHAVLVEFPSRSFPAQVAHRFFDLRRRCKLRPVLAHPERYEPVFKEVRVLDPLIDGGALLLLDVAALVGKYGRAPRRAAEELLDEGYYYAACSDAHHAKDVIDVERGIAALFQRVGEEEATFLMVDGPRGILDGKIED